MQAKHFDLDKREELAMDRSKWRSYLQIALKIGEQDIITAFCKCELQNEKKMKNENCQPINLTTLEQMVSIHIHSWLKKI